MQKVNNQEDTLIKLMDGISDIESVKNGNATDTVRRRENDG